MHIVYTAYVIMRKTEGRKRQTVKRVDVRGSIDVSESQRTVDV